MSFTYYNDKKATFLTKYKDQKTFISLGGKLLYKGGFPGTGFASQEKMTVCTVHKAGSHLQLCCLLNIHTQRLPDIRKLQFKQKAFLICGKKVIQYRFPLTLAVIIQETSGDEY